jgi:NAD(P)-dependent dehydrogenase (short-subunit alcohol dehydrogenase family)
MSGKETWFITGAGRGMGVDIARAARDAGHAVVATGRNTEAVREAVGESDDLLVVELDITSIASAEAAVRAAFDRFGRIDVLVNNAGNFFAGFFEELSPDQVRAQIETNLRRRHALPGRCRVSRVRSTPPAEGRFAAAKRIIGRSAGRSLRRVLRVLSTTRRDAAPSVVGSGCRRRPWPG